MADAQTSEVDAKLAPINAGAYRVQFGKHENYTIICDKLAHTSITMCPIAGTIV
jgi:hypothetical protein